MFTSVRNHEAGINEDYLQEKMEEYVQFSEEMANKGEEKPLGIKVLIFDEVKVMAKVMFNVKTEQFVGFAMAENGRK